MRATKTAQDLNLIVAEELAKIDATVDDFYADRATYEEFGLRMRENWGRVRAMGIEKDVLAAMRWRMA